MKLKFILSYILCLCGTSTEVFTNIIYHHRLTERSDCPTLLRSYIFFLRLYDPFGLLAAETTSFHRSLSYAAPISSNNSLTLSFLYYSIII